MNDKKSNRTFLIMLLGFFTILLICALLFTFNAFGIKIPLAKTANDTLKSALKENNYQAAYTAYLSSGKSEKDKEVLFQHVNEYFELCQSSQYTSDTWTRFRGLEIFKEDIQQKIFEKMDELVSKYYSNNFTESETKTYLQRFSKFSFADDKYDDCIKQIGLKDFSDKAYLEGVNLYNSGKIEEAVKEFRKVSSLDDSRYPLALDAIKRCKSEWGAVKISEAQKMIEAYNKEGARALLENLIEVFGGYEEAENLLSTLDSVIES